MYHEIMILDNIGSKTKSTLNIPQDVPTIKYALYDLTKVSSELHRAHLQPSQVLNYDEVLFYPDGN